MKTTEAHPFVRLFGRYLRDQGFPMTQQRASVADVVFGSDDHLSVEEIEGCLRARSERIGKATIYRTLDLLVRSKLVDEHDEVHVTPTNREQLFQYFRFRYTA